MEEEDGTAGADVVASGEEDMMPKPIENADDGCRCCCRVANEVLVIADGLCGDVGDGASKKNAAAIMERDSSNSSTRGAVRRTTEVIMVVVFNRTSKSTARSSTRTWTTKGSDNKEVSTRKGKVQKLE